MHVVGDTLRGGEHALAGVGRDGFLDEQALRDHMRTANRRSGNWIKEAVRAKDRMEKEYFDYRISVDAFGRLLESYPATRKKLAQQVGAGLLVEEAVAANARKRVLATSKRVADDVQRARQLAAVQ